MNKAPIFLLLILLAAFFFGKVSSYASENEDVNELKLNKAIKIDEGSRVFEISGEGKNKTQFRIKDNRNDEDSEFMVKGTISAASSDSVTIDGKVINLDSSITEEIKIVGKLEIGAYAMAKGIVKDSSFYAEKIVVDQRNKKDIEEENEVEEEIRDNNDNDNETATVSATPTPTVTVDDDEDENATMTAQQLDFGNIINAIQNFLNYLKDIASKI